MSSVFVTNDLITISLTEEELLNRSFDGVITNVDARRMICRELELAGFDPWPSVEIELFMGHESLLLIARPASVAHCFAFGSLDDLLCAAEHIGSFGSSLVFYDGKYSLIVSAGRRNIPLALFEFGDCISKSNRFAAHIMEHGEMIIEKNVPGVLLGKFRSA